MDGFHRYRHSRVARREEPVTHKLPRALPDQQLERTGRRLAHHCPSAACGPPFNRRSLGSAEKASWQL